MFVFETKERTGFFSADSVSLATAGSGREKEQFSHAAAFAKAMAGQGGADNAEEMTLFDFEMRRIRMFLSVNPVGSSESASADERA